MVDWNGLFKWSMKYQDEEHKTDIKPMDEETKKWLTEAMEEYSYDQSKRMNQIMKALMEEELGTKEDEDKRYEMLDELFEMVEDGIEQARDFQIIGGLQIIFNLIMNSQYEKNRLISLEIFNTSNQNNTQNQAASISIGGFNLIKIIIDQNKSVKEKEFAFSALNCMIRGEFLEGKRQFIETDGVEFIIKCMQEIKSDKIQLKAISLLKDLVFYDERLHLTVNNTELYANTNAKLKVHKSQTQGQEQQQGEQQVENNELEENKKYQHLVKQKLIAVNFVDMFCDEIFSNFETKKSDMRGNFAEIMTGIVQFSTEQKQRLQQRNIQLKEYFAKVIVLNKENDGINEFEISKLTEFLKLYL